MFQVFALLDTQGQILFCAFAGDSTITKLVPIITNQRKKIRQSLKNSADVLTSNTSLLSLSMRG